ncbi:MAG: HesA/MoeB/ThiF family protein [Candidatus Zipacnadales bacterium]
MVSCWGSEQLERYARNLVLPDWGLEAQSKLQAARVLVIGAGGLGSPCLLHLAAVGVGHVTIVDGDCVELSNLNRQILHPLGRLGAQKAHSAAETLLAFRPDLEVTPIAERFTSANAYALVAACDLFVDCADNYETRFLANDVAVATGKPLVHGSVFQYEGQLMDIVPGEGPCLRCLYTTPPPPHTMPSPAEAGIAGFVPGVIGTLQAAEVVKLITGLGEPLKGRMLVYEALEASFEKLIVERSPHCPVCGVETTARWPSSAHEK